MGGAAAGVGGGPTPPNYLLTYPPPLPTPRCPQNTDITKRNLVHEGPLTWRVTRDKAVGE